VSLYIICHSETCLHQTSLGPIFVLGIDQFIQVILTKISDFGTLSKVRLIQDSDLLTVQFRLVWFMVFKGILSTKIVIFSYPKLLSFSVLTFIK
jgi:hypothetical protein